MRIVHSPFGVTLWCALAALAACDAGAPSCKDAVAKAVKNGAQASDVEQASITTACETNKWSGDMRGCLGRSRSKTDAATCLKPVMADIEIASAALRASPNAKAANEHLDDLRDQLVGAGRDVDAAVDAVVTASSDPERSKAQAALAAVRARKADLEATIMATKAAAAPLHVSKECLDNPLAAGC